MCRIAEVLISLQQVGNVKYIGWIFQVPCTMSPDIVQVLQEQAKFMEDEFCKWKNTVKHARHVFYELNYYTTLQLLSLRKELGAAREADKAASISPSVLALLESISPQVTSNIVCDVIQDTALVIQETDDAEDEQSMDSSRPASASVGEEIMASADPQSSRPVKHNDNPQLTEADIDEKEKAIMAYVTTRIFCSKVLVLKAFEMHRGMDMDKYDYERWCNNNMDTFQLDEGESSDESCESDEESSSSESESNVPFTYSPGKCIIINNVGS